MNSVPAARILVIEDDSSVLSMLQEMLENAGYEVVPATNGEEGLQKYRDSHVNLVITDILMPKKDGIETIRELRKTSSKAKIIAITGTRGSYNRLPAASYVGAQRTLLKPSQKKTF